MWKGWVSIRLGFSRRVHSHTVVVYVSGGCGVRDHAWIRREHVTDDVAINRYRDDLHPLNLLSWRRPSELKDQFDISSSLEVQRIPNTT